MENTEMHKLINEFGKTVGLPDLAFDEDGYCCLFFDETVINMEMEPETGRLFLYANIGEVPREGKEAFYEMLLEGNYFYKETGGGAIGIDREENIVVLICHTSYSALDLSQFEKIVETFVHLTESWKAKIAEFAVPGEGETVTERVPPGLMA